MSSKCSLRCKGPRSSRIHVICTITCLAWANGFSTESFQFVRCLRAKLSACNYCERVPLAAHCANCSRCFRTLSRCALHTSYFKKMSQFARISKKRFYHGPQETDCARQTQAKMVNFIDLVLICLIFFETRCLLGFKVCEAVDNACLNKFILK